MPEILATQEADLRRIEVQRQAQANSLGDPVFKETITKKGLAEWLKR
jgi:hypothetical protein